MEIINVTPPFSMEENFWISNKLFVHIEPFTTLFTSDTTPKKEKSSAIMWAIWLHEYPSISNPLRRLPLSEKLSGVQRFCPDFDPGDKLQAECISKFNEVALTPAAKAFKEEEQSLQARTAMILSVEDKLKTMVQENPLALADKEIIALLKVVNDMRKNAKAVFEQYDKVKQVFQKEEGNILLFGGGNESILEERGLPPLPEEEEE